MSIRHTNVQCLKAYEHLTHNLQPNNKDYKTLTKYTCKFHLIIGIHQSIYNIILDWVGLQNHSSEAAQSLQNVHQENMSSIISFLINLHIYKLIKSLKTNQRIF